MSTCPACGSRYDGIRFCPNDGSRLLEGGAQEADRAGEVVDGRYRILGKVGEGGMGEIYEAEHIFLSKRVALKLLRRDLGTDMEAVQRLHREARSTSAIGHPNIVQVVDFGHAADGAVYLAMEWLEGMTLDTLLEEGPVDAAFAVDLVIQACTGLKAAHETGVVHRDLKPGNVFLTRDRDGRPLAKLLDFGIAKLARAESNLTRTGQFVGTPHYIAPEQAQGEAVDERADIYSLGVILYELVTGTLPFQADSVMAVLHQHVSKPPEPPRTRAPGRGIAADLEAVILRCLAKAPGDRYPSAAALEEALEAVPAAPSPEAKPKRSTLPGLVVPADPTGEDEAPGGSAAPEPALPPTQLSPSEPAPGARSAGAQEAREPKAREPKARETEPPPRPGADDSIVEPPKNPLRGVAIGALALLLAGGAGLGGYFMMRGEAGQAAAGDAGARAPADAGGVVAETEGDAAPEDPAAYWTTRGETAGFSFRATISPRPLVAGEPLTLELAIEPLEPDVRRAIRGGDARAHLQTTYYLGHEHHHEADYEIGPDGELEASFTLPKDGKYHVPFSLTAGGQRLGGARFDVCVGADPAGPRASEVCPRLRD